MARILDRLKSISFDRLNTDTYIDVIDVLTFLRNSQGAVSVCFEGDTHSYHGKVSALNARRRIMVIQCDLPVPPFGLNRGTPLIISTELQGREITLQSKFIEPLVPDFSYGYEVSIPASMVTLNPRAALRTLLDEARNRVSVTLKGLGNETISGIVRDISTLGLGLKAEIDSSRSLSKYLAPDQHTVDCQISLGTDSEIDCKIEIRNVRDLPADEDGACIGGRIVEVSRKDSLTLSSFINELQRKHVQAIAA